MIKKGILKMKINIDNYVTPHFIAKQCNVTVQTVYFWIKKKKIFKSVVLLNDKFLIEKKEAQEIIDSRYTPKKCY